MLVVPRRADLLERVIPFFERNPLLSDKRKEFDAFKLVVVAMATGEHLQRGGFDKLVATAMAMNGDGRYRKWQLADVVGSGNPQRLHAEHLS